MKRALAIVISGFGCAFYGWHTLGQGNEPHFLWLLIGGVLFICGLWFALAPKSQKR